MSKGIWHTKDEIPRQESRVLWKSGNVICGGRFDTHYKCFCGPASQFVDLRNVSCWAYLDDLLALEPENKDLSNKIGKLEPELDRTRKALGEANEKLRHCVNMTVEELDELKGNLLIAQDALLHFSKDPIANNALKKITTPKQKD